MLQHGEVLPLELEAVPGGAHGAKWRAGVGEGVKVGGKQWGTWGLEDPRKKEIGIWDTGI